MRKWPLALASLASTVSAGLAGGCGDNTSTSSGAADMAAAHDLAAPPDLAGTTHFRFILDQVLLPDSSSESTKYLYDVDGSGTKVNKLVAVVDALKIAGVASLQGVVDASLADGKLIELLDVATLDPAFMNDVTMSVSGYAGKLDNNDPTQLYTGSATVDLDLSEEPDAHTLQGILSGGHGDTQHLPVGAFPIHFPLQGVDPVPLTIYGAHVTFQTIPSGKTADGGAPTFRLGDGQTFHAMINGGLSQKQIHERLVPAIAQMLNNIISMDPNGQNAMSVRQYFDANKDGTISPDEVENQPIVASILSPDSDLFDDKGNLAPNQDKVKDSMSFGVGFTAVPAWFTPPAP